jgi:predicted metal-dependent hydrolase
MQTSTQHRIRIGGRLVNYNLVHSKAARKLRVRVGPSGVEVIQPSTHNDEEASDFLVANGSWILDHLNRAKRLGVDTAAPATALSLRIAEDP